MRRAIRATLGVIAFSLVGAGALIAPAPAGAAPAATAGVCKDASGVTVVVDLSALGGDVIVRCVKGSGFSGLDALKKAGFSVAGTQQSGLAYVCRIQGRPSATEPLAVKGNPGYKEACVVTPPTSAYWGYWYAKNGGAWTYSNTGAASHPVIKGGFEGWAFSLNRAGSPPKPAYTPTRPKAPTPPPTSQTPQPTEPSSTAGSGNGGGSGGSAGSGPSGSPTSPNGSSQSSAPSPADDPKSSAGGKGDGDKGGGGKVDKGNDAETPEPTAATGDSATSDDQSQVTGELPEDPMAADDQSSSSSAVPTLIGIGLLVVLAGGAGYTAWRRSHRG